MLARRFNLLGAFDLQSKTLNHKGHEGTQSLFGGSHDLVALCVLRG
jgi:hypothetical protein